MRMFGINEVSSFAVPAEMGGWIDQVENNVKYIRLLLEETKV